MELNTSVKRLPKNFIIVLPRTGIILMKFKPTFPAPFHKLFNPLLIFLDESYL